MDIQNIKDWGLNIKVSENKPLIISGPCSAETKEQVLQTCKKITASGVHILRGGIWKPRTRPGSFEGLGIIALPWLIEASKQTGLPVCCEVANAYHIEEAIKHGVHILWIGARTTVNPFAVQEIAEAIKGIDIPVMIKNPVNPDLELWLGAFERLSKVGIKKFAAIHRGFSVYNSTKYRNEPQWEIPIELHRRLPNLEIICDPSHIAGKRSLLYEVAQHAMNLNFDGLMIESHINPDDAWSDALQQVTPKGLKELLSQLIVRQTDTDNLNYQNKINHFRNLIDQIDSQVLDMMDQRMNIVRKIGAYKKESNIAILQIERWRYVRDTCLAKSNKLEISQKFVEEFINTIHNESILQQTAVMHKK
ncbi:MAG: bifunctional 3-deoxy-7-phosphoheptulonate synthase/chorismate mutase type II [Saprospiraceae bacterium]|nr:bifunctional 3-deoxy-7-phosphoheptulonate synthase/chorismate mutase type II [Saprospiraceae bacterium]